jgi:hypothetical protein
VSKRTRELWLAGFVLFVTCVAGYVVWLAWPRPGITESNCARIQVGMTLEEVEALLGGPAGSEFREAYDPAVRWRAWEGPAIRASIAFDSRGKVVYKTIRFQAPETWWFERWRRLLLGNGISRIANITTHS